MGESAFHAALDAFNRENGADGPHMTRQVSSTIFDVSVFKEQLGRLSYEFDARKFLVESRSLSTGEMPALVRAMWSTAKTTVVDPAQAAESRLVEATRRADKAGPPTPSPPFGSAPPRGFCAGLARGSDHVFRSVQAGAEAQVANQRMTAAETESAQTKESLARLTERKEAVETERDKAQRSGVRLMKERDDALKASGCGADRLIPLQQRTADGHGESLAGRRIWRSLRSRGSWLRDTKRRTIYVSRSMAEVLPPRPRIFALPFSLVLV
jgi:hypothetical protein